MKRRIFTFFLVSTIMVLPATLRAQNNFRKGYIITNQNDTLQGDVRLPSKFAKEARFSFRKDGDTGFKALAPQNISAIKTGTQYFVSTEVPYNENKEALFLEVLSEGAVNTYRLDKDNYYIQKGDKIYHLTNVERKYVKGDGSTYSFDSKKYIGLLAYVFKDEPQLKNQIRNTSFTSKSLIKISKEYNKLRCPDCPFVDYTQNIKHSVFIEPQAGISYASLTFKTSDDHITDLSPTAGIDFRFVSSRNPNWSYITGVHYSSCKFEGEIKHSIYYPDEIDYITLNYSTFSIPLIVEYTFGNRKLQPSVRLGYNNVIVNYSEYSVSELLWLTDYAAPKDNLFSQNTIFKNYQIGILAGTGIRYRLNENSFLLLNGNWVFRVPSVNAHYLLEKQRTTTLEVSLGYSFRIK